MREQEQKPQRKNTCNIELNLALINPTINILTSHTPSHITCRSLLLIPYFLACRTRKSVLIIRFTIWLYSYALYVLVAS